MDKEPSKIAITGTKGKTTIVMILEHILSQLGYKTLAVDTHNVRLHQKEIFDQTYSNIVYQFIPSKCPGRFLYLGFDLKKYQWNIDVAILEATLGCCSKGLGYSYHDIGIFTNVYEDHLGSETYLQSKDDIAKSKSSFIRQLNGKKGYAIYNGDDPLICKYLQKDTSLPKKNIDYIIVSKHKPKKQPFTFWIQIDGTHICIYDHKGKEQVVYDTANNYLTLNGFYTPNIWNIAFSFGGIIAYLGWSIFYKKFSRIKKIMNDFQLPVTSGRVTKIDRKGRTIILDYAHEKQSLKQILQLGHAFKKNKTNNVIGVVRLAPDRTNKLLSETGSFIAPLADKFIVYDKIDGIERKEYNAKTLRVADFRRRLPGEVMHIFSQAIKKKNPNTTTIIYRKDAMTYALTHSKPGDVVVIIVHDPKKTGLFIQRFIKTHSK